MKKVMMVLVLTAIGSSAFAKIPLSCMPDVNETIAKINDFNARAPGLVASGELTEEGVAILSHMQGTLVESTAIFCAGMKVIQLDQSFGGKLGLVSQEYADQESNKTEGETLQYIRARIQQK
jgi:hypothetical protein